MAEETCHRVERCLALPAPRFVWYPSVLGGTRSHPTMGGVVRSNTDGYETIQGQGYFYQDPSDVIPLFK